MTARCGGDGLRATAPASLGNAACRGDLMGKGQSSGREEIMTAMLDGPE
jgi:hypothetical protein